VSNVGQKDIIALSQGTLNIDYNELILPAMEGLRDRANTVAIVVLGDKGRVTSSWDKCSRELLCWGLYPVC
jgi:hypothetical protein